MRVVHINHSFSKGGAAQAMLRLDSALKEIGIESSVCSLVGGDQTLRTVVPQRESANVQMCGEIQSRLINQNRTDRSDTIFTFASPGCDLRSLDVIKQADVINLHWINYFLSPVDIRNLYLMGKSIVWTIHDEWPYTGGCHYRSGCDHFLDQCSRCPQLMKNAWSLPEAVMTHKRNIWQDIPFSIVGPSSWIVEQAKASGVFGSSEFYNILNSIDTNIFQPLSKKAIRSQMGIPNNAFVVLFGADVVTERRKGFDIFNAAVTEIVSEAGSQHEKLHLLCFGDLSDEYQFPVPVTNLGYLNSSTEIARAYQASDLYVLPSLEDNLPNTMLESMACGTPVVGFNTGGIGDLVVDDINGYLVSERSSISLATRIRQAMRSRDKNAELGLVARRTIYERCRHEVQASNYLVMYESGLAARKSRETESFAPPDNVVWISGIDEGLLVQKKMNQVCSDITDSESGGVKGVDYQDSTVFDCSRITFLGGFKNIEGPYPEYNLPEFVWCFSPRADISVKSEIETDAVLRLELQSPFEGGLVVENNIQEFGKESFFQNFGNAEGKFSIIEFKVSLIKGENYFRFLFVGSFEDTVEVILLSKIEIIDLSLSL